MIAFFISTNHPHHQLSCSQNFFFCSIHHIPFFAFLSQLSHFLMLIHSLTLPITIPFIFMPFFQHRFLNPSLQLQVARNHPVLGNRNYQYDYYYDRAFAILAIVVNQTILEDPPLISKAGLSVINYQQLPEQHSNRLLCQSKINCISDYQANSLQNSFLCNLVLIAAVLYL